MPYCGQCGVENKAGASYCSQCGAELPRQPNVEQQAQESDSSGISRRALLIGGGVVGVAAVTGVVGLGGLFVLASSGPGHSAVGENAWDNRSIETTGTGEIISGTVTLEPGQFTAQELWTRGGAGIGIHIQEVSDEIDIYTIRDHDMNSYRSGDDVPFVSNLFEERVDEPTTIIDNTNPGTYYVSLDNTPVYGAESDGPVTIEVRLGVGAV